MLASFMPFLNGLLLKKFSCVSEEREVLCNKNGRSGGGGGGGGGYSTNI